MRQQLAPVAERSRVNPAGIAVALAPREERLEEDAQLLHRRGLSALRHRPEGLRLREKDAHRAAAGS